MDFIFLVRKYPKEISNPPLPWRKSKNSFGLFTHTKNEVHMMLYDMICIYPEKPLDYEMLAILVAIRAVSGPMIGGEF